MSDLSLASLMQGYQPAAPLSLADLGRYGPRVLPTDYNTKLPQMDEFQFRQWLQQNNVPFDPNAGTTDYDMRGYWQGVQQRDPRAKPTEINVNDGRPHYTDAYKTPLHQTFSSGSQWAGQYAPQWINDHQLAAPNGRIVFDERR